MTVGCCPGSTCSTAATSPSRCCTTPSATTRSNSSARSRPAVHGRARNGPASPGTISPSTSSSARSPAPAARPAPSGSIHRPWRPTPWPDRPACTRGTAARTVNFLPRPLHELRAPNRADQQDPRRRRLYATRSGVEGTICGFINGHRARRSRYHGHRKTHLQHVLTGTAIPSNASPHAQSASRTAPDAPRASSSTSTTAA
ncbi:transposase [Streptomyces nanhaiensis]|uniref:transposase n=1 Tax=Streptomyces nanhaiensis TaxID=679319 RepID=UPI00399CA023